MGSEKAELIETERTMLGTGDELGEWGCGQRVQTSSDKMSKFWGPNVQHGD